MKKKGFKQITVRFMVMFLLAGILVLVGMPAVVYAAEDTVNFAGGDGTAENPYKVATAEHLNNVRNYPDKCFLQTEDIPLPVDTDWVPIGGNSEGYFTGTYDGGSHLISNLTITRSNSLRYLGLFGYVGTSGTLKNLSLEAVNISSTMNNNGESSFYAGGLAGYNKGSVSNCSSSGTVSLNNTYTYAYLYRYIGGLIGYNDNGSVSSSSGIVEVKALNFTDKTHAGGLIGYNKNGSVRDSSSSGSINAATISSNESDNTIGGLIGKNDINSTITNSSSSAAVTGTSGNFSIGGLVGYNNYSAIESCYSTGSLNASEGYAAGGLIGYSRDSQSNNNYSHSNVSSSGTDYSGGLVGVLYSGSVYHSYSIGKVEATGYNSIGGLVGISVSAAITNSYYDSQTSGQIDTGKGTSQTTAEMKQQSTFNGWDFNVGGIWKIDAGLSYPKLQWQPLTPDESIAHDLVGLEIGYQEGDSADSVTKDLTLPVQGESGTTIGWHSDTPSVIADDGRVTRPADADKTVVLTATVSMAGGSDRTKTFTLTIAVLNSGDDGCLVTYKGAQARYYEDSNTYDIRFIAIIDTLDAKEVGFVFSKIQAIPTRENASERATSTVYTEITASGSTITAASLGGQYIIACTVTGIPVEDIDVVLHVRAFSTVGTETKYTPVTTVTVADLLD